MASKLPKELSKVIETMLMTLENDVWCNGSNFEHLSQKKMWFKIDKQDGEPPSICLVRNTFNTCGYEANKHLSTLIEKRNDIALQTSHIWSRGHPWNFITNQHMVFT